MDLIKRETPVRERGGESRIAIGSRFHSLVGALSQGVPSIGTSWSHKYEMLFDEYGCPDMILPVPADAEAIRKRIKQATGGADLRHRVEARSDDLKAETRSMWRHVDNTLLSQRERPSSELRTRSKAEE